MSKHKNKRCIINGVKYDSQAEGRYCDQLRAMERFGSITNLTLQPKYDFTINGINIGSYTADARYFDKQKSAYGWHVIDIKSPATAKAKDFRRTLKLMRALHGVDVEVIIYTGNGYVLPAAAREGLE